MTSTPGISTPDMSTPDTTVMNPYGQLAWDHWKKWRPTELSQIPDPVQYFARLGLEVEAQIEQVASDLAGDDPTEESYLAKVGRLRMAQVTAESQVLRELVLIPAEPGHPEYDPSEDPEQPTTSEATGEAPWLPVVMTADHPSYHDLDDDPLLRKTYLETNDPAPQTSQTPQPR